MEARENQAAEGHMPKPILLKIAPDLKPEDMDDISEGALNKFIENAEAEYKENAALFGASEEKEKGSEDNSGSDDDASDLTEDEIIDEITSESMSTS